MTELPVIRIRATSETHARAIWGALEALGCKWGPCYNADSFLKKYPFAKGKLYGFASVLTSWPEGATVTYDSIEAAIRDIEARKSVIVPLNDSYEAHVTPAGVTVGCQTFSLDAIKRLATACTEMEDRK